MTCAPTTEPADVPTTTSASVRSRPARASPARMPSSQAMPVMPPPPRTSAVLPCSPMEQFYPTPRGRDDGPPGIPAGRRTVSASGDQAWPPVSFSRSAWSASSEASEPLVSALLPPVSSETSVLPEE